MKVASEDKSFSTVAISIFFILSVADSDFRFLRRLWQEEELGA